MSGKRKKGVKRSKQAVDEEDEILNGGSMMDSEDDVIDSTPRSKRVKFASGVSSQTSLHYLDKYAESAIDFPRADSFLTLRVGHDSNFQSITQSDSNSATEPYLILFHAPYNFNYAMLDNQQIRIPKLPQIGKIVYEFTVSVGDQILKYNLLETSGATVRNMVNLFSCDNRLKLGKPFERHFHIIQDFTSKPKKSKVASSSDAAIGGIVDYNLVESSSSPSPSLSHSSKKRRKEKRKSSKKKNRESKSVSESVAVKEEPLSSNDMPPLSPLPKKKKKSKDRKHKKRNRESSTSLSVSPSPSMSLSSSSSKKKKQKKKKRKSE